MVQKALPMLFHSCMHNIFCVYISPLAYRSVVPMSNELKGYKELKIVVVCMYYIPKNVYSCS